MLSAYMADFTMSLATKRPFTAERATRTACLVISKETLFRWIAYFMTEKLGIHIAFSSYCLINV